MLGEAPAHRLKNPLQRAEKETFWALKDIEFDIKKGDVVGIIGRNGAGFHLEWMGRENILWNGVRIR